MIDHPPIDFDGDGTNDAYETVQQSDGEQIFVHYAGDHITDFATDDDHDGLVDKLISDTNGNGELDTLYTDDDGDGYMDTELALPGTGNPHAHPFLDFDGDGQGDAYHVAGVPGGGNLFAHSDGLGHVDALALDENDDALIDVMFVDKDSDAHFDHLLIDLNGDGIMDTEMPA